jgi:hypothetical protein
LLSPEETKDDDPNGEAQEADVAAAVDAPEREDDGDALGEDITPERVGLADAEPTVVYERATGLIVPVTPERTILERPAEPIINRAEPLAAVGMVLGAAEHHRVTKVKRRTEQLEKAQKETIKQKEHLQDKYEQLETQIQQVAKKMSVTTEKSGARKSPEAEPVASTRAIVERHQAMVSPSEHIVSGSAATAMEKQVNQMTSKEQSTPSAEILPEVVASTYKVASPEASPDAILHNVEKAAEENIPLEAVYELRQEVKDKDSVKGDGLSGGIAGASAGRWLNPSVSQPSGNTSTQRSLIPNTNSLNELWDKQPPAYKQAITVSAGAAVLVVLAVAIIMAIVK